jgi:hypothetical protein
MIWFGLPFCFGSAENGSGAVGAGADAGRMRRDEGAARAAGGLGWPGPSPSWGKAGAHKCAPPFTEAEFEIRWGTGIDATSELLDLGIARGLVDKSGNHLSFAGSALGNGRERSRETIGGAARSRTLCGRPSSRPGR